jgi:hypothetical protein
MATRQLLIILAAICLFALPVAATTRYVDASPHTPVSPYTSWATAATNIQDAINAAGGGETILVNDGIYKFGGLNSARVYSNNKFPVIQSVNGPDVTIIIGQSSGYMCANLTDRTVLSGFTLKNSTNGFPNSAGGVFCATTNCLVTNCVVANCSGNFTGGIMGGKVIDCVLTNNSGYTGGAASNILVNCTIIFNHGSVGGGAYRASLSNCLLVANGSVLEGGGAYGSILISCTLSNNASTSVSGSLGGGGLCLCTARDSLISSNRINSGVGGGAYSSGLSNCVVQNNYSRGSNGGGISGGAATNCVIANNATQSGREGGGANGAILNNCLVTGNAAFLGAGVGSCTANNCTIVGNMAIGNGGAAGAYASILNNSIIYYNQAATTSANISGCVLTNCCTPSLAYPNIANSFTNAPSLVDPNGDFHLQSDSPCINAGNNSFATLTNDFDGNPRIVGDTVDVGAYEYQYPSSVLSYAWLQQYNLPTDGSVDFTDDDGDGMTTWQEWMAGTDPTDPASLLQMISATPTNNNSRVLVNWQSVGGKLYQLQRSTNLTSFSTIQSNLLGQSGATSYTDASVTNSKSYFYRVGLQ